MRSLLHPRSPSLQACRGHGSSGTAAGQAAHTAAGQATETSPAQLPGTEDAVPGRTLGKPTRAAFRAENFWGQRGHCRYLGESVPQTAGTGPPPHTRRSEAQPRGAPLGQGQGRCRADPPPARLSVWPRGEGRGAPPPGRENDPRLPARPPGAAERGAALTCGGAGAGWAAAAASLGWGPRCGHRSPAGQRRGEPGPGSWQRRGPYGAAPAAGGAGGRAALGRGGGREGGREKGGRGQRTGPGDNRAPPAPPRRAGDGGTGNPLRLSPPCRRAAATGGGGRCCAEPQRRWRGRREGRAEPPARPHLGAGPVPSLRRLHLPDGRDPRPAAARRLCPVSQPGQGGSGAPVRGRLARAHLGLPGMVPGAALGKGQAVQQRVSSTSPFTLQQQFTIIKRQGQGEKRVYCSNFSLVSPLKKCNQSFIRYRLCRLI